MSKKPSERHPLPTDDAEVAQILDEALKGLAEELEKTKEGTGRKLLPGGGWTGSGN